MFKNPFILSVIPPDEPFCNRTEELEQLTSYALAVEPSKTIVSKQYISKHDLGSIGGVQSALKKLRQMDLVEIGTDSLYRAVDPIFSIWLRRGTWGSISL